MLMKDQDKKLMKLTMTSKNDRLKMIDMAFKYFKEISNDIRMGNVLLRRKIMGMRYIIIMITLMTDQSWKICYSNRLIKKALKDN